ncbi:hypothetical protein ACFL2X_04210 [Candidatus Latescibacterota bacterium]
MRLLLKIISIILVVPIALLSLFLVIVHLDELENIQDVTRWLVLTITALASIFSLFRPYFGGIILCVSTVTLFFIIGNNPIPIILFVICAVSIIRGLLLKI